MASGSGGLLPGAQITRAQPALSTLTIRSVLVAGFLVTAGIWIFAGTYFSARIRTLESDAEALSSRYRTAQETVNGVRNQVYRASIFVRDALLDPQAGAGGRYREDVENAYGAADQLLAGYSPVVDSASERDQAGRLRREISELHVAMLDVLSAAPSRSPSDVTSLLRVHVPRRDAAIRVADDLQTLTRAAFVEQQAATARLYRETQVHFGEVLGLGVLASLGVALVAGIHVSRMERSLRDQQEKDARLAADLQRLSAGLEQVQEEERRLIARELHDEVGQVLTAVKMELLHAQREISAGRAGPDLLTDARSITDRALHAVRDISQLLHPPLLDDRGLPAALHWYLESIRKRQDLAVEFSHPPMSSRFPADIEVALYRVVQEGVTNVLRHAEATTCRISLTQSPDRVIVTVEDDGVGFDSTDRENANAPSGLGLLGIRERVARLGGTLSVETVPWRGTTLRVELPVEAGSAPALVDAGTLAPTES